eukprot:11172573-Lingulodinium_polyedra.AAC.1
MERRGAAVTLISRATPRPPRPPPPRPHHEPLGGVRHVGRHLDRPRAPCPRNSHGDGARQAVPNVVVASHSQQDD